MTIRNVIQQAFDIVETSRAKVELRPSSFPYCPLQHIMAANTAVPTSLIDVYNMSVGTLAHRALQRYMGLTGRVMGNWHCTACDRRTYMTTSNKCQCGQEMAYREVHVKYRTVKGHLDSIYIDEGNWIVDYKTTGAHLIDSDLLPYKSNKAQTRAYTAMSERALSIPFEGYILVYFNRSDPRDFKVFRFRMCAEQKKQQLRLIMKWERQFDQVKSLLEKFDKERLLSIVESKPCGSRKAYMKGPYENCPLESVCFGPQLIPTLMMLLDPPK